MKKLITALLCLSLALSLAACSGKGGTPARTDATAPEAQQETVTCVIVAGAGTDTITVAGEKCGVRELYVAGASVTVDSKTSALSDLKNGMTVVFDGTDAPASVSAESGNGDFNDIAGLYYKVITDLWTDDPGLNDSGDSLYLDLSAAPCLDDNLKAALVYLTEKLTGKKTSAATWAELEEKGIFNREELCIEDGVYIGIKGEQTSSGKITFNAQKYVGGDGAIFFEDCKGERNRRGEWTYKAGSLAIA